MKLFELRRTRDSSGVSGIGVVAQGVIFDDGTTILHWLGDMNSSGIYPNIKMLVDVHGHQGDSTIVYVSVTKN